ncbi:hypothetical protein Tco_0167099 [Tanacetum coccineum]
MHGPKVRIFRPFSKDILSFHDSSPELLCFPIFMSFAMIFYMFDFMTYLLPSYIYAFHDHELHGLPLVMMVHVRDNEAPVCVTGLFLLRRALWVLPSLHGTRSMVIGWCVLYSITLELESLPPHIIIRDHSAVGCVPSYVKNKDTNVSFKYRWVKFSNVCCSPYQKKKKLQVLPGVVISPCSYDYLEEAFNMTKSMDDNETNRWSKRPELK